MQVMQLDTAPVNQLGSKNILAALDVALALTGSVAVHGRPDTDLAVAQSTDKLRH